MEYLAQEADYNELVAKQNAYKLAAEQNQEANRESRKILADYYDKILFYSASIFSFTVALVSTSLVNKSEALSKVGFLFHNVYWLYLSWTLLISACVCVLLSKRFDSAYVGYFGMANCDKKRKDYEIEMQNYVTNHPPIYPAQQSPEGFRHIGTENIEKLNRAIPDQEKGRDSTYIVMRLFHKASEVFALLGIISLFIFSIQLTQALVWKEDTNSVTEEVLSTPSYTKRE